MTDNFSIYGVSKSFARKLEWAGAKGNMIRKDAAPAIRAVDYKCPKYVWYVQERE